MTRARTGIAVVLWALLSSIAQAQQKASAPTARIVGVVIDEAGAPVKDAIAVLDSVRYRQTDARGQFRFDSLTPGTHRLEVRSIGFSPVAAVLRLAVGTADAVIRL